MKPLLTKGPSGVGYWKLNEMPGCSKCLADIYFYNYLKKRRSFSHNVCNNQINCWLYCNNNNTDIDLLKETEILQSLHEKFKLKKIRFMNMQLMIMTDLMSIFCLPL